MARRRSGHSAFRILLFSFPSLSFSRSCTPRAGCRDATGRSTTPAQRNAFYISPRSAIGAAQPQAGTSALAMNTLKSVAVYSPNGPHHWKPLRR